MKTYTVTEIEKEDWDNLKMMTVEEAIEIANTEGYLRGYLGSYNYGSKDSYDYDKAKIYKAFIVLSEYAQRYLDLQ